MSRIGKPQPKPSAPGAVVRRVTGESLPAQRTTSTPTSTSTARGAASGFDTRRTYSRLTGVSSKKARGNSYASLGRVDDEGCADGSTGRNRGTPDDSIGRNRGTPDDSIGRNRGTPDDSIGRNRGTPDDSIGSGGKKKLHLSSSTLEAMFGMLPRGRRGEGARDQLAFLVNGGQTRGMRDAGMSSEDAIAAFLGLGGGPRARDAGTSNLNRTSRGQADAGLLGLGMFGDFGLGPTGSISPRVTPRKRATPSSSPQQDVLDSRAFKGLPADERDAIRLVMDKGGVDAAAGMAELFKTNHVALLHEADADGVTILQHLEALAGSDHPGIVGDILSDIATPMDIEQGYAPTCTAASMQYELAKERPAEYARLLAGLVLDGQVTMAGGGLLQVNVDEAIDQSNRSNDQRTDSEAVFQTAAMDFANGEDVFSIERQRSEGADRVYRGLYPEQIRTMVGQLFNEHYVTREITSDAEAADELSKLASREGPNRPVLFDLNMGSFNHLVSLEEVTSKSVKYRDPATGEVLTMSRRDFIRSLVAVHYAESMSP
jgi:hypothetical protein